ncbi:MAG: hypothetical protein ACOCRX_11825 [Candidatus Woesearchaeota archaeon]
MYEEKFEITDEMTAGNDKDLLSEEKETHFYFTEESLPQLEIETSIKPIIKLLMKLNELNKFEIKRIYTKENDPNKIYYISGTTKIGFLRLKPSFSGSMNYLSRIIN